jgi:hypothetical protein
MPAERASPGLHGHPGISAAPHPGKTRRLALDIAGIVSASAWAWLAFSSRAREHVPLGVYFAAHGLAWAAFLAAWIALRDGRSPFPDIRVVLWALVFRAIGIAGEPLLEDDHHRYLWDGRTFATTGNPYASAPIDHFADRSLPPEFQDILTGINHPDLPTIYGPVCQLSFLASYWIAPASLVPLKTILIVADLLLLALVARVAGRYAAFIYAWCPLLVKEVAFTAHPEILGVAFAFAALVQSLEGKRARAGLTLAFACAARPLALILAPFVLRRAGWRGLAALTAGLAALYLPFIAQGSLAEATSLRAFVADWEFNSLGFAVLAAALGEAGARVAAGAVFAVILAACFGRWVARGGRDLPRGDLVYGVFFLLAPVVNPWYLLWLLPFVAAFPSAWGITALAAVNLSYAHGSFLVDPRLAPHEHPPWVRPLEAVIVAAGAVADVVRRRRREARRSLLFRVSKSAR